MAILPEQKKGVVMLFNACHWWFNPVLIEFGMGVAALLAGEQYSPTPFFGMAPWMLRGQLLIPAFQIASIVATQRKVRRWRLDPRSRPSGGRILISEVLLPLLPNLAIALTLQSLLSRRRHYLRLYMPDYVWIARVCGSFAAIWAFLRTGLVLGALGNPHTSQRSAISDKANATHLSPTTQDPDDFRITSLQPDVGRWEGIRQAIQASLGRTTYHE
jgi:hypothetical protein